MSRVSRLGCAHNIHHVGRIWAFLTYGHMKKSNCHFLIAQTQKNAAYSYCRLILKKKNMKELPIHSVNGAQDQDPGK